MTGAAPKRIVLSANSSWNLVNFRGGVIRALVATGHEVFALAPADEASPRLAGLGCVHVPLPLDTKGTSPAHDLALLARYASALRRLRPDAYLGFTVKPNVYGSLAAQGLGIPVVNTISGLGTAFIRDDWLTRLVRRLYRLALARSQTVFFQNGDDLALFVDGGLVRRERTALLPGSGIDTSRFAPRGPCAGRQEVEFVYLLVGRMLWDKGVGEFVEAARIIRSRFPRTRFRLLGFVDSQNLSAIGRSTIDGWVGEGLVEYLGAADDVRPHLARADCVVLPSYREGAPRALLEAAAMAKPLIATDVPGCREVVEDGRNGFLCRPRDAADLAARMADLYLSPSPARSAMGVESRKLVERKFDERIVVARYLSVVGEFQARMKSS